MISQKLIEQKEIFGTLCSNITMQWKDFLFPKICLSCGSLGSYICLKCQGNLCYAEKDFCLYCSKGSFLGFTHPLCQRRNGIDGVISIFRYNDTLKKLVKNIKYRLVKEAIYELLQILDYKIVANKLDYFQDNKNGFYLNSIPLHPIRFNMRGFNQSQIITHFFNKLTSIPIIDLLERIKNTPAQAQLEKNQARYLNVKNAFQIKKNLSGFDKNIILVDDLVTTGATLKASALILKKAGAKKVFALTLARG